IRGFFRVAGVPAGSVTLTASRIGYLPAEQVVVVSSGTENRFAMTLEENALQMSGIVVSVSREAQRLAATPASVGVVTGEALRRTGVSHPGEAMRQIPGAWVSVTSGEGHQTAIRQPLTTSP